MGEPALVDGYDGYEVSGDGEVRNLERPSSIGVPFLALSRCELDKDGSRGCNRLVLILPLVSYTSCT